MLKKKKKPVTKSNHKLVVLEETDILKPLSISDLGSSSDPCFGKGYDLSTKECKMCGDSEICAIAFAQNMNKTRGDIEKEQHFKDMDVLIDIPAVKKFMRSKKREGLSKLEVMNLSQEKYKISKQDARLIYRSINSKK